MSKKPLHIIKVGGKIVENPADLDRLLADFSALPGHKALVHGGGRSATSIAEKLGIESKMVDGRRITDSDMLRVVTMVYGGLVNKQIVAGLQARNINALGLTGADLNYMLSQKRPVRDIDYGFVGDVKNVDAAILADLINKNITPVLAPLTHDGEGNMLNTNADTIAAEAAKALAAHFDVTLTYCFEKKGVLADERDDKSVIELITPEIYENLLSDGTVSGGMIPKLDNAFDALQAGVSAVIISRADLIGKKSGGTKIVIG